VRVESGEHTPQRLAVACSCTKPFAASFRAARVIVLDPSPDAVDHIHAPVRLV
jgi:hypothetical protein